MTQVTTAQPSQNGVARKDLKGLLAQESIQKRFKEILGEKAPGFISSILNTVNGNTMLAECDPQTVIMSAAVAATLDLPINPNLGFAYIIPYNDRNRGPVAQFQMGYKGFIQLAKRSGQYLKINAVEVRAGQLKKTNHLTEEFEFDFEVEGGEIIGFVAYFKELNGFEKTVYWNVTKVNAHAKRYSKSFGKPTSPWTTNYPEMALKTVLKHAISKYGTLSIQMQKAMDVDQAVIKDDKGSVVEYVDHTDVTDQKSIENATPQENHEGVTDTQQNGNTNIPSAEEL